MQKKEKKPRSQQKDWIIPEEADSAPIWKEVALVGTELDQIPEIHSQPWFFPHLETELNEGILSQGKDVYLFGSSEPLTYPFASTNVYMVPVIYAISCNLPPFNSIAITSVQMQNERIVSFKDLKLDWVPFSLPDADPSDAVTRVHVLKSIQRKASAKSLSTDQIKSFTYAIPYVYNPFRGPPEEYDTTCSVPVMVDGQLKPYEIDFQYGDLRFAIDDIIEQNSLPEASKEEIKELVKKTVIEAREKLKAQKEKDEQRKAAISPEERESLETMKIYKFYPSNWQGEKAATVNRYFGKADQVMEPKDIQHKTFPTPVPTSLISSSSGMGSSPSDGAASSSSSAAAASSSSASSSSSTSSGGSSSASSILQIPRPAASGRGRPLKPSSLLVEAEVAVSRRRKSSGRRSTAGKKEKKSSKRKSAKNAAGSKAKASSKKATGGRKRKAGSKDGKKEEADSENEEGEGEGEGEEEGSDLLSSSEDELSFSSDSKEVNEKKEFDESDFSPSKRTHEDIEKEDEELKKGEKAESKEANEEKPENNSSSNKKVKVE
ncbi:putative protein HEAT INTOLERANT 4 [Monocercomonoides exilis]|uniref:putative protein HEAT INTOLERANT 4 n=1 Tax=Monocercomonoides exilis TaxID=2049356 RepID=UPI00355A7DF5|nr:putative protein HEAT INTOLERANT 4 [Monocercomonoides exilis]|eukprot:MONOS_13547.1-p1 / transcript=MONOS_13547.1 / gene=MONOS_13547 / organism=Monocercomonoides_exilis_PA203 / gene_product=117M18_4 / transcript_product=117M18_4 / location=Mono_scaffold00843:938-2736(-) / protein_length=547 / sequence_SO=supercontig / SO=protein_coding / is_pseudo=false